MLLEGLHVDHLRLILGTSMGCMQSFVWGETYPSFTDALAPFACLPVELAGRNRMMRYMAIENIKHDPAWNNGDYTTEPVQGLRAANEMLLIIGLALRSSCRRTTPPAPPPRSYVDNTLDRTHRPHRRQQLHLLRQRLAQLQPRAQPRHHHRSRSCGSTPPTTSSTHPS